MAEKHASLIPVERIERAIIVLRGEKVMLDEDLAVLYGVPTKQLLQAVRRNKERFPDDFMFQLSPDELEQMRSHDGTATKRNVRYRPYAFTEQGVAMLSSVLRSPRAVDVNIEIMRAFVRLRHWAATNAELARRLDELEKKYDEHFSAIFQALRQLMAPPTSDQQREMGYHTLIGKADSKSPGARRQARTAKAPGSRVKS